MPALSSLLRYFAIAFVAILPSGCFHLESIEERQVKKDREHMRRGEPLVYHRDSFELSDHAMRLRLGKRGGKQVPVHEPGPMGPPPIIDPAGNKLLDVYGESQQGWQTPPGRGYPGGYPGIGYPSSGSPGGEAPGQTALGNSSWNPGTQ